MSASEMQLIFADRFGVGDHLDRVLGDVGGDGGVLGGGAEAEQADARHQDHARQRIEFLLLRLGSSHCCARNSRDSARRMRRPRRARRFVHSSSLPRFRRGHDQRPVLGADGVVGRHHALLAVARTAPRRSHSRGSAGLVRKSQDLPLGGAGHGVLLDAPRRRAGSARSRAARAMLGRQLGLRAAACAAALSRSSAMVTNSIMRS